MSGGYTFAGVPTADIPRSTFNRSHGHKTTFDAGQLIPFFVDEALPGDTFKVSASMFARLATPIFPIMDNLHLDVFWFFVPNRLLWSNWQKFMGEQENPGDSIDYLVPQVIIDDNQNMSGSLYDYLGVPVGVNGVKLSALFPRAYNLIYNEWFRDENLVARVPKNMGDGPDSADDYGILNRGKRHDYFTSCLPWPQKGPGVEIPIAGSANVLPASSSAFPTFDIGNLGNTNQLTNVGATNPTGVNIVNSTNVGAGNTLFWANPNLIADLSEATATTINSLRQAFQIQKLLERDARGGTRYVELLRSHFGVVSPDARLQRPEYLGGGSVPVQVNPVSQTSQSTVDSPQGNLAAYGIAAGRGIGFSKSFVEHGVVLGILCARADLSYQQGIPRMYSRRTRYDFYWPAFANLGEQAVLNKEIYFENVPANDEAVFGYQERWAEYRYYPSKITGKFRSGLAGGSLDSWHLAQYFTALPRLNNVFITENVPLDRCIAVPSEPHFLFDSHISMECTRPMPVYSVPGMIDHF